MTAATATRPTRKRRAAAPPPDRVTQYAEQVLAGDIIAGPHVRAACTRHLRDLQLAGARGFQFSRERAAWAIAFFEEVLKLNGGQFEGLAFRLQGWQAFIVGSLFGWLRADGARRFRVAYVETGKGSGKSPLAAGVGLFGLVADGEARAEVYAAATKKDQAQILFRDAVAMYEHSPELHQRLTPSGRAEKVWNLAYHKTGSFFRTISADDGASGPRPHVALVDEVHEHKTMQVVEMMRAGTKSRRQALIFMITNSGAGENTPCGVYHDYAAQVSAGKKDDDAFFGFVCGLDDGDDPLADETCWPKANPSLQHANLPGLQYLREQVTEARGMPAKEALVRRLNFCQWTQALNPWLSAHVWEPCRGEYVAAQLRGLTAWGGLDLSSTTDLTAFSLLVEADGNNPRRLLTWCWLPEQGLRDRIERDRVPYDVWHKAGHLELTPGAAISKRHVLIRVAQICAEFNVPNIAADRWRLADLKQIAQDEGIELPELIDFGQGFKDMSPAIDAFETALLNRTVQHDGHPVLQWAAGNAVTTSDPAGNRKLDKAKATGRIDPIVAAVMAHASAAQPEEASGPAFFDLNAA